MNPAASHPATEHPRSEARRAQILAAAEDCFRRHGFHGASISQISKESGMSPGHIYHYFENKEAIIAAIVEKDVERIQAMTAEFRSASDVRQAMIDRVAEGVREKLDPGTAGLRLEIVAEAARNPRVAEIVRAADRQALARLAETLRQASGEHADEQELAATAEVMAVMFEGLAVRAIRNPHLDAERVTRLFRRAVRTLLGAEEAGSGSS